MKEKSSISKKDMGAIKKKLRRDSVNQNNCESQRILWVDVLSFGSIFFFMGGDGGI